MRSVWSIGIASADNAASENDGLGRQRVGYGTRPMLVNMAVVALGGAVGSMCRYGVTLLGARLLGPSLPYGTFFVNVSGSFLMGTLVELLVRRLGGSEALRLLLATGFLGGYTTFSSFSLDAVSIWARDEGLMALGYVLASVVLGILALAGGMALVRQFV